MPDKPVGGARIARAWFPVVALTAAVWAGSAALALGQAPRAAELGALTRQISANGAVFPVAVTGEGPAVLLLHGFPDDRFMWRYQVAALADAGYRVIAPDLRGYGDAPRPQDPKEYGIGIAEKDVIGILDALGVQQAQLVAHDWGAAVGWRLAADYPTRITRYVAMSVGAPGARTTIEQREKSWYMLFFRQTGTAEQQLMANNWELFREWARNPVDIDRWLSNLSRPGALTAALNWYRATGGAPAVPASGPPPQVQCPVLGLWSDGDRYLTEYPMRSSGERIKGPFEYARIAGASHWMMVDKPAEINAKLLGFLRK